MLFNWLLFVRLILPPALHTPIRLAWLDTLVSPLRKIYNTFRGITDEAEFATKHSGLKIYLEKALNDKFDPLDRSIFIENVNDCSRLYIYRIEEPALPNLLFEPGSTSPLAPLYIYSEPEYWGVNDFVVNIGSAVVFNQGALDHFITSFKPVGKRYTINIY